MLTEDIPLLNMADDLGCSVKVIKMSMRLSEEKMLDLKNEILNNLLKVKSMEEVINEILDTDLHLTCKMVQRFFQIKHNKSISIHYIRKHMKSKMSVTYGRTLMN